MSFEIGVSDHCIIRYLERHYKTDIDKLRSEILPDHIKKNIIKGAGEYIVKDMKFYISGATVTTCVPIKNLEPLKSEAARKKHKKHKTNKKQKNQPWQSKRKHSKKCKRGQWK